MTACLISDGPSSHALLALAGHVVSRATAAADSVSAGPPPWPPSLATLVAAAIVVGLIAYALFGGADFGGGIWDLLASGPRRAEQRALIADAIGPIWEANHVWLIIVVVLLFTCFPPAFAWLAITLHIPFSLMLIGIVLRGSAFSFRAYDSTHSAAQERWGRVFAIASVVTPVLLGVSVGAIVSEGAGRAPIDVAGASFVERFVAPWLTPFALVVGALALVLFAFLAAVYLTVEAAGNRELQDDFRRRALAAAGALFVIAAAGLVTAHLTAPRVRDALVSARWALPFHLATGVAALAAIGALLRRAYRLARFAAAAQVTLILVGWTLAQYPYLVPPRLTIAEAAAPRITLQLVLVALVLGGLVLFPSLIYLFRIFKRSGASWRTQAAGPAASGE
jgi:cytochrome bd ubiquinol oxidase subunit II